MTKSKKCLKLVRLACLALGGRHSKANLSFDTDFLGDMIVVRFVHSRKSPENIEVVLSNFSKWFHDFPDICQLGLRDGVVMHESLGKMSMNISSDLDYMVDEVCKFYIAKCRDYFYCLNAIGMKDVKGRYCISNTMMSRWERYLWKHEKLRFSFYRKEIPLAKVLYMIKKDNFV